MAQKNLYENRDNRHSKVGARVQLSHIAKRVDKGKARA